MFRNFSSTGFFEILLENFLVKSDLLLVIINPIPYLFSSARIAFHGWSSQGEAGQEDNCGFGELSHFVAVVLKLWGFVDSWKFEILS